MKNIELRKLNYAENLLIRCVRIWVRSFNSNIDPIPSLYVALEGNGVNFCVDAIDDFMGSIFINQKLNNEFGSTYSEYLSKAETKILKFIFYVQENDLFMSKKYINSLVCEIYYEKLIKTSLFIIKNFSQVGLYFDIKKKNYKH